MNGLSEIYFRPKAFELNGRLYTWMGVLHFKNLLVQLARKDSKSKNGPSYLLADRSRTGIQAFEKRTRRNELIHLMGLLMSAVFLFMGFLIITTMIVPGILVLVVNFHSFILQRYNRIRIYRLLSRL